MEDAFLKVLFEIKGRCHATFAVVSFLLGVIIMQHLNGVLSLTLNRLSSLITDDTCSEISA